MKKISLYDLFLFFSIILFMGNRNIYSSILLLLAGVLELIGVIPKLIKEMKDGSK